MALERDCVQREYSLFYAFNDNLFKMSRAPISVQN